jgi:hypothetical protein
MTDEELRKIVHSVTRTHCNTLDELGVFLSDLLRRYPYSPEIIARWASEESKCFSVEQILNKMERPRKLA